MIDWRELTQKHNNLNVVPIAKAETHFCTAVCSQICTAQIKSHLINEISWRKFTQKQNNLNIVPFCEIKKTVDN